MGKRNNRYYGGGTSAVKPAPDQKTEPAFDESTTALSKLMKSVCTARKQGYPFILLDTMEVEVVRDVAYHIENPIGHVKAEYGAMQLLEGNETASADNCINVVWYDYESKPKLAQETGYNLEEAPALWVMVMNSGSGQYLTSATGGKVEFLRKFALRNYLNNGLPSYVLMYGDPSALPEDLKTYTHVVDIPYPSVQEIQWRIRERMKKSPLGRISSPSAEIRSNLDGKVRNIAQSMRGLTYAEVDRLADYLLNEKTAEGKELFLAAEKVWKKVIAEHKQQSLKRNGNLLELQKESNRKISGMGRLEKWIRENKYRVTAEGAHKVMMGAGVSAPKGILLHGTPGCGKSDVAKLLQKEWGLPLLKMDMGRLMGGLLGDSERLMRNALRQAEACSPCILFIDEIEKALTGISGGPNSNDSIRRMISHLLGWLSDDRGEDACFVYCTANSLEGLPKELYRKGRLDVLFSVSLPTCSETEEIFLAQLENMRGKAERARENDSGMETDYALFAGEQKDWKKQIREKLIEGKNRSLLHPQIKGAPERDPLFVSGSDIVEIVNQALLRCYGPKRDRDGNVIEPADFDDSNSPTFDAFILAAQEVISSPTMRTSGSGEGNLKALAKGYVNAMRGAFIPVSAENEVLFDPEDYSVEEEEIKGFARNMVRIKKDSVRRVKYESGNAVSAYDRALYAALIRHIEQLPEPQEN